MTSGPFGMIQNCGQQVSLHHCTHSSMSCGCRRRRSARDSTNMHPRVHPRAQPAQGPSPAKFGNLEPELCGMCMGNPCCAGCGRGTLAVRDVVGEPVLCTGCGREPRGWNPKESNITEKVSKSKSMSPTMSGRSGTVRKRISRPHLTLFQIVFSVSCKLSLVALWHHPSQ